MRERPSDNTRKLALPKLRTLTMRPAVTVSTRGVSSSAALFAPCASTSCDTECVVSNLFGYGAKPRRRIASRFARRCSVWTTSLLNDQSLFLQLAIRAVKHTVDELGGLFAAVGARQFDRFADHDARR